MKTHLIDGNLYRNIQGVYIYISEDWMELLGNVSGILSKGCRIEKDECILLLETVHWNGPLKFYRFLREDGTSCWTAHELWRFLDDYV